MTQKQKAVILKHILLSHMAIRDLMAITNLIVKDLIVKKEMFTDTDDLKSLSVHHTDLLKNVENLESHLPQIKSLVEESD